LSDRNDSQRAAFDDDRLLDFALGLDDDPELAAALSHSARLRERLADLKSDLAAIDAELRRSIPPAGESYTQPGAARWSRLWPFFGRGAARRRPLRGRRLAAALAAAALAIAVIVGATTILPRSTSSSSGGSRKNADLTAPRSATGAQSGAVAGASSGAATSATSGRSAVAAEAAGYRDVAVVRVGPVRGAGQSYTVLRTLKGSPPTTFSVVLQAIEGAPQSGSLAVAYLDPLKATTSAPSPAAAPEFSFAGRPALIVALPAGVTASSVHLP